MMLYEAYCTSQVLLLDWTSSAALSKTRTYAFDPRETDLSTYVFDPTEIDLYTNSTT